MSSGLTPSDRQSKSDDDAMSSSGKRRYTEDGDATDDTKELAVVCRLRGARPLAENPDTEPYTPPHQIIPKGDKLDPPPAPKKRPRNKPRRPLSCPLCITDLDATERDWYPCQCGYQLCLFCYGRITSEFNNLCPGCRTAYDPDTQLENQAQRRAAARAAAAKPLPSEGRGRTERDRPPAQARAGSASPLPARRAGARAPTVASEPSPAAAPAQHPIRKAQAGQAQPSEPTTSYQPVAPARGAPASRSPSPGARGRAREQGRGPARGSAHAPVAGPGPGSPPHAAKACRRGRERGAAGAPEAAPAGPRAAEDSAPEQALPPAHKARESPACDAALHALGRSSLAPPPAALAACPPSFSFSMPFRVPLPSPAEALAISASALERQLLGRCAPPRQPFAPLPDAGGAAEAARRVRGALLAGALEPGAAAELLAEQVARLEKRAVEGGWVPGEGVRAPGWGAPEAGGLGPPPGWEAEGPGARASVGAASSAAGPPPGPAPPPRAPPPGFEGFASGPGGSGAVPGPGPPGDAVDLRHSKLARLLGFAEWR